MARRSDNTATKRLNSKGYRPHSVLWNEAQWARVVDGTIADQNDYREKIARGEEVDEMYVKDVSKYIKKAVMTYQDSSRKALLDNIRTLVKEVSALKDNEDMQDNKINALLTTTRNLHQKVEKLEQTQEQLNNKMDTIIQLLMNK